MKNLFCLLLVFTPAISSASVCQAPSQGMMEYRLRETFFLSQGELELKEWMIHPRNTEIRQKLKELDRRIKFSPQRLQREELLAETQINFEQAIMNTGRPHLLENFPAPKALSKVYATPGALSLEMKNFSKETLDFLPPDVLEKLEPQVKLNYIFPYDKFDYYLTYNGKELPMQDALLLVQQDMEDSCERRMIDNFEYRNWYRKKHGGGYFPAEAGRASGQQ
jgi:hypothetical protein